MCRENSIYEALETSYLIDEVLKIKFREMSLFILGTPQILALLKCKKGPFDVLKYKRCVLLYS